MLYAILAAIAALAAVIIVRTMRFVPPPVEDVKSEPVALDEEKIVRDMQDMIRCRTVSNVDMSLIDKREFERFQMLLAERFPRVHAAATLEHVGVTGLLYHLPGKVKEEPSVLMAHYDVVPVDEAGWEKPPFDAVIEDGVLWGRGTLDTKGTLLGVFEALEMLLGEGYVPEHDLYLSFAGDEEVSGESCPMIVELLRSRGIVPAMVLDEGGAVVDRVFPGVKKPCAVIGVAEKGSMNVKFTLNAPGGHASTPPTKTVLGQLSRALVRLEKHPFPRQLVPSVARMFDTLGRHSSLLYRMLFANLWLFEPVLDLYCRLSGGELNALMRTTVAPTRMEGSKAYNVLPSSAYFAVNMRLLGNDNVESALEYLRKTIKNDAITLEHFDGMNPSICSDTDCEGYRKIAHAVRQTWPEAIVSPYQMLACSDSRHYCAITDKVYRFSAMHLSKEERGLIHGNNERVPIETLLTTVRFYVRLLHTL